MLRSRYCSSYGGRPCPASRGSSSICAHCTPRVHFVQIVQIVRAQTHFYYAFRYGDQDGYSPLWRSVALRCSGQSADAHPHSPPFYCPQCVTSLLVSSNSLCPLSVSSPTPLDTVESDHCSPGPRAGENVQQGTPHSVSQTPILDAFLIVVQRVR